MREIRIPDRAVLATLALVTALLTACATSQTTDEAASAPVDGEGPCVVKPGDDAPTICTADYRPVCGCNDVTYPNACRARAEGVQRFTEGRCDHPDPTPDNPLD